MAKLIIDPEVDEYDDVLELLDVLYGRVADDGDDEEAEDETADAAATTEPTKTTAPIEGFTPARMRRYISNLTVEGAKALRFMAENAPSIDMDDVQTAIGVPNPRQYAGTMSTFGHAKRVTKGVDRMPFDRHYRTYSMDERVAKMALAELDKAGL